jgi:oligoendopeptidase F
LGTVLALVITERSYGKLFYDKIYKTMTQEQQEFRKLLDVKAKENKTFFTANDFNVIWNTIEEHRVKLFSIADVSKSVCEHKYMVNAEWTELKCSKCGHKLRPDLTVC